MTINQYLIIKGAEIIPLLGIEACVRYTKKGYTPEDINAIMEGK